MDCKKHAKIITDLHKTNRGLRQHNKELLESVRNKTAVIAKLNQDLEYIRSRIRIVGGNELYIKLLATQENGFDMLNYERVKLKREEKR